MNAVNTYVGELRTRLGRAVPDVDSIASERARIILVFRQPNLTGAAATGQLSTDNPDRASAALRARLAEAEIPPSEILFWNIIPWAPVGEMRQPTHAELLEGAQILEGLLQLMTSPRISVILLGSSAAQGGDLVRWDQRGGTSVFEAPSSSPPEGNKPETKVRVREALRRAYEWVKDPLGDAGVAGAPGAAAPTRELRPVGADRSDVEAKLAECDSWVRSEFERLQSLCAPHTSSTSDESGPGRRFKTTAGPWFWRLHPKQTYIAVGFPNSIREQVGATGHLREQREAAWVKYDPSVSQELIAELLAASLANLSAGASRTRSEPSEARTPSTPAAPARPQATSNNELVAAFEAAMRNIYDRARRECDYTPSYFAQMITDRGGVGAARALIAGRASEGFARLWELKRLDLSVEALIQDRQWMALFTEEERASARRRLREAGFG